MSAEGPFPKTLKEAVPYITWGSAIFTFFFMFVEKLVERDYGEAIFALVGGLVVTAVAIHSKTWLERTSPNWVYPGVLVLLVGIIFSPFVEEKRWPFSGWIPNQTMPSADEIADAVVKKIGPLHAQNTADAASAPIAPPPRSKQTITELLEESGKLLDLFSTIALPLAREWGEIRQQNPELICITSGGATGLREKANALADKMRSGNKSLNEILEVNRLDRAELSPLVAVPNQIMGTGFNIGANALDRYRNDISQLGDHPTCENLVHWGQMPNVYLNMATAHQKFADWAGQSRDHIEQYRDKLRLELRGAP